MFFRSGSRTAEQSGASASETRWTTCSDFLVSLAWQLTSQASTAASATTPKLATGLAWLPAVSAAAWRIPLLLEFPSRGLQSRTRSPRARLSSSSITWPSPAKRRDWRILQCHSTRSDQLSQTATQLPPLPALQVPTPRSVIGKQQ